MSGSLQGLTREPGGTGLLSLAESLNRLKSVPRTGWSDRGVAPEQVESVADHTLSVALLAWACAVQRNAEGAQLDPARVLLLALLHDLAEAETGDMTPYDPAAVPDASDAEARRTFLERRHVRDAPRSAQKRDLEDAAMRSLIDAAPAPVGKAIADLWQELRDGSTAEARFVKQADRLETFLQSLHYLRDRPDLPMDSFRKEVLDSLTDPLLTSIRDAALKQNNTHER